MEVIFDGWLLKSPPPKRLWRAKWRNRWFVLRSGDLPGQYFLEYYTDESRKKLKGKIDLDQCEQVDAGITFADQKLDCKFMFDIKTPKRVYYLCAETEDSMNRWVDCVCQVCGLKVMSDEDLADPLLPLQNALSQGTLPSQNVPRITDIPAIIESPPPSAASTISGPYIPISECITGKKISTKFPFNSEETSVPLQQAPSAPKSKSKPRESYDTPRHLLPSEDKDNLAPPSYAAPPRPPKPSYLMENPPMQEYMNLTTLKNESGSPTVDSSTTNSLSPDQLYEFPRSHHSQVDQGNQRRPNCYTNSAPAQTGRVFLYDETENSKNQPPTVHRKLKPKKSGEIASNSSSAISMTTGYIFSGGGPSYNPGDLSPPLSGRPQNIPEPLSAPPIIDRNLKPPKKMEPPHTPAPTPTFILDPAPVGGARRRGVRSAPSPTPPSDTDADSTLSSPDVSQDGQKDHQMFFPLYNVDRRPSHEIQYLDLDLEGVESNSAQKAVSSSLGKTLRGGISSRGVACEASVVYKKVDFVKTEAFNKMRQNVEEGYRTGKTAAN